MGSETQGVWGGGQWNKMPRKGEGCYNGHLTYPWGWQIVQEDLQQEVGEKDAIFGQLQKKIKDKS